MRDDNANQQTEALPVEAGSLSLRRAVVLHSKDLDKQTLGFPPIDVAEPKRVIFSTPLHAMCLSVDGLWSTNCLVVSIWDSGAQLEATLPGDLTEFYLLFTAPPKPVSRQCRRVNTCGTVIEVACQRKQPAFLLNTGIDL